MKKNILRFISAVCIMLICLWGVYGCIHNDYLEIKENVEEFMCLQHYGNCYLTKVTNFDRTKRKEVLVEVAKDEIDSHIKSVLSENYYREKITDRNIIEVDDLAICDYYIRDEEKEICHIQDARIRVGTGYYDVFLENSILGLEVGKEHTVKWNVPDGHENEELAGKKVIIYITVKDIYKVITPSIEEYILQNGFETVEEYKKHIKNILLVEKKETLLKQTIELIVDEFIEKSHFQIDKEAVVNNASEHYFQYEKLAEACNVSVEDYILNCMGENQNIYDICYKDSLREIKRCLIIGRYAKEKGITITGVDIGEYCKKNNIDHETLTEEEMIYVEYSLVEEKVLRHIGQRHVKIKLF